MNLRSLNNRFCPVCDEVGLFRDSTCLACERAGLVTAPAPPPQPKTRSNALSSRRSERASYRFNNRERGTGGGRKVGET